MAQRIFDVPIALVSLVDEDRQWFKSRQGLDVCETPREQSFCAHAIHHDDAFHVRDATDDERFADNPLVLQFPEIRFYAGHPIKGPRGAKLGTICVIGQEPRELSDMDRLLLRDLAEMVEAEVASMQLATTDELTGLGNRRGFDLLGEKVVDVCRRIDRPVALLFADLNGLKQVNDRDGHEAGDELLRTFAGILEERFRASDVVARLGGDEFAVLLTGSDDAETPAADLRRAIDRHNAAGAGPTLSAAIGVATIRPADDGAGLADLVRAADEAMYADKRAGR